MDAQFLTKDHVLATEYLLGQLTALVAMLHDDPDETLGQMLRNARSNKDDIGLNVYEVIIASAKMTVDNSLQSAASSKH